jgi:hypothetical protein
MVNRILMICLIIVLMIIGGTYLYNTVTSHSSAQANTSGTTPTPVPPSTSTPTQPSATPTATTPPSTSAPTQPVATPTEMTTVSICQTNQLALAFDKSDGLDGNRGDQFSLQNMSTSTCTLEGYPAVQMLLATHQPTPTQETQSPNSYFFSSAVQIQTVSLQPGAKSYFVISWRAGQCTQPAVIGIYIQVTPPADTGTLTASTSAGSDGGIDACGAIYVSPISATSVLL